MVRLQGYLETFKSAVQVCFTSTSSEVHQDKHTHGKKGLAGVKIKSLLIEKLFCYTVPDISILRWY